MVYTLPWPLSETLNSCPWYWLPLWPPLDIRTRQKHILCFRRSARSVRVATVLHVQIAWNIDVIAVQKIHVANAWWKLHHAPYAPLELVSPCPVSFSTAKMEFRHRYLGLLTSVRNLPAQKLRFWLGPVTWMALLVSEHFEALASLRPASLLLAILWKQTEIYETKLWLEPHVEYTVINRFFR